jgi:hypothetical protein
MQGYKNNTPVGSGVGDDRLKMTGALVRMRMRMGENVFRNTPKNRWVTSAELV